MIHTKVVEKIKTHILRSKSFFSENRTVYEIMSKNAAKPGRSQVTIWRLRIACWITSATDRN